MSVTLYDKSRQLLDICEKLASLGERDLELQVRKRVIQCLQEDTILPSTEVNTKPQPTQVDMSKKEEEREVVEELTIREIQGHRFAWNPVNNHCYELYPNDDVGKWVGKYDANIGRVDITQPDPENSGPNWMNQAAIGMVDPYKKDSMRRILIHGEEVAISTSSYKLDGSSTIATIPDKILAVNMPGAALGFIYKDRLYNNPTSLVKAVFPSKTLSSGWIHVCLKRPISSGELKWKSLYVLDHA